jgi:hypothetical protein
VFWTRASKTGVDEAAISDCRARIYGTLALARGGAMKRTFVAAGTIVFFALAGCVGQGPEVDQIAQRKMIGLFKGKILACLGIPAKRVSIGSTDIWTYPIGDLHVESPFPAPAPDMAALASPGAGVSGCNVNVVMTNSVVSQVVYHSADGGPLPLGRQCLFAVRNCTEPPEPFVVHATY